MNILFIGNSYTYYNDMPTIFQALARENGKDVTVTAVTKGARRLDAYRFTEDATTQKLVDALAQQRYDVCFLQEQSVLPAQNYDSFAEGIRIVSGLLGDRVDRVVLYATWGRKAGHKTLESNGWDTETMANLLSDSYEKAGAEFGFTVSPVGKAFLWVYTRHPEVELYDPDMTHPSYAGSCLAALTHYRTLFGEYPENPACLQLPEYQLEAFKNAICK